MRFPRSYSLPPKSIFHMMWRAINGEFMLGSEEAKAASLDRYFRFFPRVKDKIALYAFAAMSNHMHNAAELREDSTWLSSWVRSAHCSIGRWVNKTLGRRGPVAQDRPKTVVAQNQEQLKRIMFYLDWNPVRAGLCKHPSEYRFSSYRYYAFGEINEWTMHLTQPRWYLNLGSTPKARQKAYRVLCDVYRNKEWLPTEEEADCSHFIGSDVAVAQRKALMRTIGRMLAKKLVARPEMDTIAISLLSSREWETNRSASRIVQKALWLLGMSPPGAEAAEPLLAPACTSE